MVEGLFMFTANTFNWVHRKKLEMLKKCENCCAFCVLIEEKWYQ